MSSKLSLIRYLQPVELWYVKFINKSDESKLINMAYFVHQKIKTVLTGEDT